MVEWKKIPNRDNYSVSDDGQIRNDRTGKILKQSPSRAGYARVSLSNGTGKIPTIVFTHRVVAEVFIPNPNNLPQVNHLNSNRMDASKSNLEWVTPKENMEHALRSGNWNSLETSRKANKVSIEKTSIPVIVTDSMGIEREFPSMSTASRELEIPYRKVQRAVNSGKIIQRYTIKKKY